MAKRMDNYKAMVDEANKHNEELDELRLQEL